jgi:hypothetical protein
LADYRLAEMAAAAAGAEWQVRLIPPLQTQLRLAVKTGTDNSPLVTGLDDAAWALDRWAVSPRRIAGYSGRNQTEAERASAVAAARLAARALSVTAPDAVVLADAAADDLPATGSAVLIDIVPPRPTQAPTTGPSQADVSAASVLRQSPGSAR